jgi:site-specific DNA-methyltransferase (adenine-specific)
MLTITMHRKNDSQSIYHKEFYFERNIQHGEMVEIIHGKSEEVLKTFDADSFDSLVTDPPYGLGKEPDILEVMRAWVDEEDHVMTGGGFMGRSWDAFVPQPSLWKEVYRVLKPGAHLVVFAGTRTADLMSLSLRMAGFENRGMLAWLFSQGFPKSHNVSKAIDRVLGKERERNIVPQKRSTLHGDRPWMNDEKHRFESDVPISDEAKKYNGFGTALKPAMEPILLFRKPISEKNIAMNVLKHGTGGLNIKDSRIGTDQTVTRRNGNSGGEKYGRDERVFEKLNDLGRFPSNVIFDRSQADVLDLQTGELASGAGNKTKNSPYSSERTWSVSSTPGNDKISESNSGGASRYFTVIENEPCGHEHTKTENTFVGRKAESKNDSSPIDIFGSKPTEESQTDTKSTTKITTRSITKSETSNLLQPNGTTTTTNGSEKITQSLKELNVESVNDAVNTNPSPISKKGAREDFRDIVNNAPLNTSGIEEQNSENSKQPNRFFTVIEPEVPFFYEGKSSTSERNFGTKKNKESENFVLIDGVSEEIESQIREFLND